MPTVVPSIPLPPASTWVEFPVVSVIVLCMALAGMGIFIFTRWIWNEYKCERDKDLTWRAGQNKMREEAVAEQNRQWRGAMAERDLRYEQYDRERQGTLTKLATSMEAIATQLTAHDEQAKEILHITERIEENTQRLPRKKAQ